MTGGRIRAACRRMAKRSYRKRRAEMWTAVYCTAFDVETDDEPAMADGGAAE